MIDDLSCSETDPVEAKIKYDVATEQGARRVPISCHHAGWFNQVFLPGNRVLLSHCRDPSCLAAARTLQSLANLEFPPTAEDTLPHPQLDSEYSDIWSGRQQKQLRSVRWHSQDTCGLGAPASPLIFIVSIREYFAAGQSFPPTHNAASKDEQWQTLDNADEHTSGCGVAVDPLEACNLFGFRLLISCGYWVLCWVSHLTGGDVVSWPSPPRIAVCRRASNKRP